jgi:hypothetical protein
MELFRMPAVARLLLLGLLLSQPAWADQARPPRDYLVEVDQGRYVFVMLADRVDNLIDPGAPDHTGSTESDPQIRKSYKVSGLYRTGGEPSPLWTVSWYAFRVYPDSDARHLVRMGPWASSTDQLAVSFHDRGREIRKYLIHDLVRDATRLRHTASHFFWLADSRYDDAADTLELKTVEGLTYRFSTLTGELLP